MMKCKKNPSVFALFPLCIMYQLAPQNTLLYAPLHLV